MRLDGGPTGIEAFDVANLKDKVVSFGDLHQPIGLFCSGCQWFLHQHVHASPKQCAGYVIVIDSRGSDNGGFDLTDQRFEIFEGRQLEFGRDECPSRGYRLDNANHFQLIVAFGQARVDLSEMTGPPIMATFSLLTLLFSDRARGRDGPVASFQ